MTRTSMFASSRWTHGSSLDDTTTSRRANKLFIAESARTSDFRVPSSRKEGIDAKNDPERAGATWIDNI